MITENSTQGNKAKTHAAWYQTVCTKGIFAQPPAETSKLDQAKQSQGEGVAPSSRKPATAAAVCVNNKKRY